jgi:hypothetical protein
MSTIKERMLFMDKQILIEKVKEIVSAPSCYEGLRKLGEDWLAAVGTDAEKRLSEKLIAALKEDVSSIDASLAFFQSDEAKSIFGAEEAANLAKKAEEFKAAGNKICFCPACQAGEAVLENASVLLK